MKSEASLAVQWSWKYDDVGGYFTLCGSSPAVFDNSEHQYAKERTGTEGAELGSDDQQVQVVPPWFNKKRGQSAQGIWRARTSSACPSRWSKAAQPCLLPACLITHPTPGQGCLNPLRAEMDTAKALSVKRVPATCNRWKRWLKCHLSVFSFCVSQIKNVKMCYAKGCRHSVRPGVAVPDFEVVGICFWRAIHSPPLAACTLRSALPNEIQGSSTLSSEPQTLLQGKS